MVIQRWQSVMLLLTFALMTCFCIFSLGQVQTEQYTYNFTSVGFSIEGDPTGGAPAGYQVYTWFLFIVSVMSAIIPLISIFLYRNLRLQKQMCLIDVLFLLAVICIAGLEGYTEFPGYPVSWSSLALAPFLGLILVVMAWRLINKDHKLLQSVDRIR